MASLARSEHRETGAATASSWRLRLLSSASVTPSTLAPNVAMGRAPALAMSNILSLPRVTAFRCRCTNLSLLVSRAMRPLRLARAPAVPRAAPAW